MDMSCCLLCRRVFEYTQRELEKFRAGQAIIGADHTDVSRKLYHNLIKDTSGAVNHMPLLCTGTRSDLSQGTPPLSHMVYGIPTMHNNSRLHTIVCQLMIPLVPPGADRNKFIHSVEDMMGKVSIGKLVGGDHTMRQVFALMTSHFEPSLLANPITPYHYVYAYLMRLVCLYSQHIASLQPMTDQRCFQGRSLAYIIWLLTNELASNQQKTNICKTIYLRDIVQHMPEFEQRYRYESPIMSRRYDATRRPVDQHTSSANSTLHDIAVLVL